MVKVKEFGVTIWNSIKDKKVPADAVFVGRPTSFFSPFSHVKDFSLHKTKTPEEAVKKYREYVSHNFAVGKDARRYLHGKDLVCNCGEDTCHALVLVELAHGPIPPQNPRLAPDQEKPRKVEVAAKEPEKVKAPKKVKYVPTFKEF